MATWHRCFTSLIILIIINGCYGSYLPRNIFGSLELSLLDEDLKIKLNKDQLNDQDQDFNKGVSLSFYMSDVVVTEEPQKIFSLYGSNITVHRHTLAGSPNDYCYNVSVLTPYNFNVTYILKGCHSRHFYLDLYNITEGKLSFLYDDLVPAESGTDKEWDVYNNQFLEESNIQFDSSKNTLEDVKDFCIATSPEYDNELCCGITLTDGMYILKTGRTLITAPPSNTSQAMVTWKHRRCTEYTHPKFDVPEDLIIFSTDEKVKISHLNIDPLKSVFYSDEGTRRYKRYELGNLLPGRYLNFNQVPSNIEYDPENDLLKQIPSFSGDWIYTRKQSVLMITEGTFLMINESKGNLTVKAVDQEFQATSVWVANGMLYFHSNENGVQQISLDGADSTSVEIISNPLKYLKSFFFYSLPPMASLEPSMTLENCTLTVPHGLTNGLEMLISFKTSQNGYRIYLDDVSYQHRPLNKSTDQEILHKMILSQRANKVKVVGSTNEGCNFKIFIKDFCNATTRNTEEGYFFIKKLRYSESVNTTCTADKDTSISWQCENGLLNSNGQQCPFYQCGDHASRKMNNKYVNGNKVVQRMLSGNQESGECCDGIWTFTCVENSAERFDYRNCSRLNSCFHDEEVSFGIDHGEGRVLTSAVYSVGKMPPNSEETLSCPGEKGDVIIRCNGCTGLKKVQSNTCKPQFCLLHKELKTFNLTWKQSTSNESEMTKFGNDTDFTYQLSGPFSNSNESQTVPCPYNGSVSISCKDAQFHLDFTSCTPAPICEGVTKEPHPLKGLFKFNDTPAAEFESIHCPRNPNKTVSRYCSVKGQWDDIDHSACDLFPCQSETFTLQGIRFETTITDPGKMSTTACGLPMCINGTCGSRLCNSETGMYSEPQVSTCWFSCVHEGVTITHGSHSAFSCTRQNGEEGTYYVECFNNATKSGLCGLKTCPFEGGAGCVETNPEKLEKLNAEELIEDFNTYLDDIDLSSDKAKEDTQNVVTAVMSKSLVKTEALGQEQKEKVTKLVDKVSMSLAKSGGKIITRSVVMYGIPALTRTRTERSTESEDYLANNGISGSGFNGSIGLAVYSDNELFSPKNASAEKLVSQSIKSVTTEHESHAINVNVSFGLTRNYNRSLLKCVYYNTTSGDWLEDGCYSHFKDENFICQCNHLTSFAVLVSLDAIKSKNQSLLTKITLYISCTALLMTIFCIIPFRKLRNRDIIKIHTFLMTSMLMADIAFLTLDVATESETTCLIATTVTHFAWLSVFGWMVAEGVTMYNQTVLALKSYGKRSNNYVLLLAASVYGGAIVIPAIALILHFTLDGFRYIRPIEEKVCFIDIPGTLLYTFLIPLYVFLCCSIFIFIRVSIVVVQSKRQSKRKNKNNSYWTKQLRAIISIATVTGISWIVAPFVILGHGNNGSYTEAMQWIFNIFMGLQGVVVFVVLVVMSEDVCNCWIEQIKSSSFAKLGYALASINEKSEQFDERNSKSKTSFGQDRSATKSSLLESYRHPSNKIMNVKLTHSLPDSGDIKSDIVSDGNALMSGRQGSEAAFQSIGSYQLPSDDGWVEFVESAQSGAIKPVKTDILQS